MNIHQGVREGESEVKSNLETEIPAGFFVLMYVQLGRSLMRTLGRRKLPFTANALELFKGNLCFCYALSLNMNYSHTSISN